MSIGSSHVNRRASAGLVKKVGATMACLCVGVALGCQEDIQAGPSKVDFAAERERLASQAEKAVRPRQGRDSGGQAGTGQSAAAVTYTYRPEARRDPFRSMLFELQAAEEVVPRAPLERFELGQISLTGVVWAADQPRALVSDPEGRAFVVRTGSRLGKNEGRVIHIGDSSVLVQETYVNFAGDRTTKDVELRMRRNQGG